MSAETRNQPSIPNPEEPITDKPTYVTDPGMAKAIACATRTDEEFLGYARRYSVPLLVGTVEAAQGRIKEADEAARQAYAAEQEATAQAATEAQAREEKADYLNGPSLISEYPVFGIVCDENGKGSFPCNEMGKQLKLNSHDERPLSDALGRVKQEMAWFKDSGFEHMITGVNVNGKVALFAYHTPGLLTPDGRPRVSLGVVVPVPQAQNLFKELKADPERMLNTYPQLQELVRGRQNDCSTTELPLADWPVVGVRMAGVAPEDTLCVQVLPKGGNGAERP